MRGGLLYGGLMRGGLLYRGVLSALTRARREHALDVWRAAI